jgi:hypothetical protein
MARQQARRNQGKDSDKLTVQDEDEDKDGNDEPQEDAVPLEARIRQTTVDMFKRVLLFCQGAAQALYNNQMVTTLDVLQDLTSPTPSSRSSAVPSGSQGGMDLDTKSPSFL